MIEAEDGSYNTADSRPGLVVEYSKKKEGQR